MYTLDPNPAATRHTTPVALFHASGMHPLPPTSTVADKSVSTKLVPDTLTLTAPLFTLFGEEAADTTGADASKEEVLKSYLT